MKKYKTLIFDLDGTLAVSKMSLTDHMAETLAEATKVARVAIITGGLFEQIKKQVIDRLPDQANLNSFYVLPTSGTGMFQYNAQDKNWDTVYQKTLSEDQKQRVIGSLQKALENVSFQIDEDVLMGEQIEDRGSQITLSALGQQQLPDVKKAWDPGREKRRELILSLTDLEDEFDVKLGGSTSIDITLKGFDKEFGINEFFRITNFDINEALFVGDEIVPEGNDWAATKTGIDTVDTSGPDETMEIIKKVLEKHECK